MSKTWLVFDVNYLCHRAFYSTGSLSFGDISTGVLYGVFRDIINLQNRFNTEHIVFCFDSHAKMKREEIYPTYKAKRKSQPLEDQQIQDLNELGKQIGLLRNEYLYDLGFNNIFWQKGYEADDIIASIVKNSLSEEDDAVIVCSDHDMYQLLVAGKVIMFDPRQKKVTTEVDFTKEYGISPSQWIDVKAFAGCSSDEVEGIPGIGEKTACKFIQGKLKPTTKTYEKILYGKDIYHRNLRLVKLPFEGAKIFTLVEDKVNNLKWRSLMQKLGMKSLLDNQKFEAKETLY